MIGIVNFTWIVESLFVGMQCFKEEFILVVASL